MRKTDHTDESPFDNPPEQGEFDLPAPPSGPREVRTLRVLPRKVSNLARALGQAKPPPALREATATDRLVFPEPYAPDVDPSKLPPALKLFPDRLDAVAHVVADEGLHNAAAALLKAVAIRDNGEGCYPAKAILCHEAGISPRTFKRAMKEMLGHRRYLWRRPRGQRGRATSCYYFRPIVHGSCVPARASRARRGVTVTPPPVSPCHPPRCHRDTPKERESTKKESPAPTDVAIPVAPAPARAPRPAGGEGSVEQDEMARKMRAMLSAAGINAARLPPSAFLDARLVEFAAWCKARMTMRGNAGSVAKAWASWCDNNPAADTQTAGPSKLAPQEPNSCAQCGLPCSAAQRRCNDCITGDKQ